MVSTWREMDTYTQLQPVTPKRRYFPLEETNRQLRNPSLDKQSAQTGQLLARWGRLHGARSLLSALAQLLFLCLAIFEKLGPRSGANPPAGKCILSLKKDFSGKREGRCSAAGAKLAQLTLALCASFFGPAFAPRLASLGASRPASGNRSGASLLR